MIPQLVTGESCGCAEKGNLNASKARSDIREYAGVMFEILEHRKTSSHGEIIRRMSECRDLYDVTGTFLGCCYMIPTGIKAELCLCDDWCRSMRDPSVYRRGGFSDKMLLGIDALRFYLRTSDVHPCRQSPPCRWARNVYRIDVRHAVVVCSQYAVNAMEESLRTGWSQCQRHQEQQDGQSFMSVHSFHTFFLVNSFRASLRNSEGLML